MYIIFINTQSHNKMTVATEKSSSLSSLEASVDESNKSECSLESNDSNDKMALLRKLMSKDPYDKMALLRKLMSKDTNEKTKIALENYKACEDGMNDVDKMINDLCRIILYDNKALGNTGIITTLENPCLVRLHFPYRDTNADTGLCSAQKSVSVQESQEFIMKTNEAPGALPTITRANISISLSENELAAKEFIETARERINKFQIDNIADRLRCIDIIEKIPPNNIQTAIWKAATATIIKCKNNEDNHCYVLTTMTLLYNAQSNNQCDILFNKFQKCLIEIVKLNAFSSVLINLYSTFRLIPTKPHTFPPASDINDYFSILESQREEISKKFLSNSDPYSSKQVSDYFTISMDCFRRIW